MTVKGGPSNPETKLIPKHKKNADIGSKKTVYSSKIFIEQKDAISFDENEEVSCIGTLQCSGVNSLPQITLMDWGNAIVRSKEKNADGKITSVVVDLNLEGDFRKTKKKITWLAQPTPEDSLPSVALVDFDYLITKKKLEENDDVKDFVTPVSEFKDFGYADANVLELKTGDIIQFERKGYYIYDSERLGIREFFKIPDGKAAGIASKAGAASAEGSPLSVATKTDAPTTTMYKVDKIYGDDIKAEVDTKMYKVDSIYKS